MAGRDRELFTFSASANSDLSANQFYCMKIHAADSVDICSAAADLCIGILQNDPKANQPASVRTYGWSKAVSDGSGTAIAAGDWVGSNAAGKIVKKATADDATIGIALDASAANGTVIGVFVLGPGFFRAAAG